MPLTGQAKIDYQRDWMRRHRAGLPKPPKPTPAWKPSKRVRDQIAYWLRVREGQWPYRLTEYGADVLDGLHLDTPEEWMEAAYRHRDIGALRRRDRDRKWGREPSPPESPPEPSAVTCSFCWTTVPKTVTAIQNADRSAIICETCIADAAGIVAERRAKMKAEPEPV